MRTFTVSNQHDSAEVSKLMFGTTYLGYAKPADAYAQMDLYYALGGRTIDTARVYSHFNPGDVRGSEDAVGEWLVNTGLRKEIFLSTKGGHPPMDQMHAPRLSKAELEYDLAASLTALNTDMVDIYWLHRDDVNRSVAEIMETLHGFVKQGMVRFLGASNWSPARIAEANAYAVAHGLTPFSASQIQWSYAKTDLQSLGDDTLMIMDDAALAAYEKLHLPIFCYESQAKGLFTKLATMGEDELPPKVRARFLNDTFRDENLSRFAKLQALAKEYHTTETVINLAYLTCHPITAGAIIGCSNEAQWRDSMAAQDFTMDWSKFAE